MPTRAAPTVSIWCAASSPKPETTCRPPGTLVVEIGQGRDVLEQQFPHLPFLWLDTAESEGEVFALAAAALHEHERG